MISNILATDMKEHFDLMKSFKDVSERVKEVGHDDFGWTPDDIRIFIGIVIHAADLSGPTKEFPVAKAWALRINTEFTNQYKEEERLGLPLTPFYKDLEMPQVMAKSEIGFVSFMVKPLWELFNEFTNNTCAIQVKNLELNIKEYEKIRDTPKDEPEK